jgi:hypothetical protein
VAEAFQVAEGEQPLVDVLTHLSLAASADLQFTEVGMTERHIQAEVSYPMADRAVGIAR